MKMAAGTMDSSLVSQCMAFCQMLADQGKDFSFKLTINSSFSFSLDTRESKVKATLAKKRTSPSTQRRNARRREEFLRKKLNFSSVSSSALDAQAESSPSATTVAAEKATFSSVVASTPAALPSPPFKEEENQGNDTLSHPSVELEEDIPDVVPGDCPILCAFSKSYSTPPMKVKHPVYGIGSFFSTDSQGFYVYDSTPGGLWSVDPSGPPH